MPFLFPTSPTICLLAGSRVFSALDGAGAFHAVPVRHVDRKKMAFSSLFGQYQFVPMPFGLANAPATYSRLVAKALQHLPSSEVLCYLDDMAVHSEDAWSHLHVLRKVLAAFRAGGLQISPEKAQLFRDHIKYLGHEVSAQGISIPPHYKSVIRDWPIPDNLKALRTFLGKWGYYRRFITDYDIWLEILASFDFTVKHRKGTLHGNADSLSRAPHAALPSPEEEKVLVSDEAAVVAALQAPPRFTVEEIKDHQERDEHLRDIQRWKTEPPTETEKQLLSPDQRRLLAFLPSLHQDPSSGLWSLQNPEGEVPCDRLYIPHALRHRVIEAAHQFLGHAGITATLHFCRKQVFMFRLVLEVHRVLHHCHACQVKSQKAPAQKDVHRPSVQAGAPFQVWSMDVLGPLRASSEGHRYLLTLKNIFSKWFEAIPLSNTTSEKVLRALQTIYARFGYPLQVHTDNATYFRSQAMQEAFQQAGVRLTFTPMYNPQSNSVERAHRDLNTMLRVLCHQHAADWEEVLPAALLALRSAVHESTGVTPFACLYGQEPATLLDLVSKTPGAPLAAHTYVRQLEDHQFREHRAVQVQLARALQCTSRRCGDEKDAIQLGEKVWLFTSKPSADRKLAIPYTGPWRVTKQLSWHIPYHSARGRLVPTAKGHHCFAEPSETLSP